jgi:hypothetical protein
MMEDQSQDRPSALERSSSSSGSSVDATESIQPPVILEPESYASKSNDDFSVPEHGRTKLEGEDLARPMSPRRTSEDLEAMSKEAREELKR